MVRLRTLGRPALNSEEQQIALRPMEAALLAYLCDHSPRALPREFLASQLWPSRSTDQSLHSLSQILYQIKKKAPALRLETDSRTVAVKDIISDVQELRRHIKARSYSEGLALLDGRFLDGIQFGIADLRVWHDAQQREVTALAEVGVRGLSAEAHSEADWDLVYRTCMVLQQDGVPPVGSFEGLICYHLQRGDRDRASLLYDRFTATYSDIPPFSQYNVVTRTPRTEEGTEHVTQVRFSGRTCELDKLHALWEAAVSGNGRAVVIAGEAGIGKTRLAHQLLRRVALSGGRVWITRCHSAKRRIPYSGVSDLLVENAVEDASLHPEAKALVDLFTIPASGAVPHILIEHHSTYQLLDGLLGAIAGLGGNRPLAVLFDDVQWSDEFTARLLALWALRLPKWSALLIMTVRTHEAESTPDWITQDLTAERINLGQLSLESATEMVDSFEQATGASFTPELRTRIVWPSAGRPLLLLEALNAALASHSADEGRSRSVFLPESAEALLRRKLQNLPHDARWVAGLMAVRGQPMSPGSLPTVSGLSDYGVASALEALSARGIVECRSGRVSFSHDLMREATYRQLPAVTRALLHRRVAEQLTREGAHEGLLAQHYARGGESDKAAYYGMRVARSAIQRCLYSDAEFYYRLVLEYGSHEDRLSSAREYGRHLAQVGRIDDMAPLLAMLDEVAGERDVWLLHRLYRCEQLLASGSVSTAELLTTAREIVSVAEALESVDLALGLSVVTDIASDVGGADFGEEVATTLTTLAHRSSNPVCKAQVIALQALWAGVTVGFGEALSTVRSVPFESYETTSVLTAALGYFAQGTLALLAGQLQESRSLLEQSLSLAVSAGNSRGELAAHANLGLVLLEMGDCTAAKLHIEATLASPRLSYKMRAYANLAIVHYENGDEELALNAVRLIAQSEASFSSVRTSTTAAAVAGLVHLRVGNWDAAADQYARLCVDEGSDDFLHGDVGYTVQFVALMCAEASRFEVAIDLLDRTIERVRPLDRLSAMRLTYTRAKVLAHVDVDSAYSLAKAVERESQAVGARTIELQARALVEATRYPDLLRSSYSRSSHASTIHSQPRSSRTSDGR